MTKKMQDPANRNVMPTMLDEAALDHVTGGALDPVEPYEVKWGTRISTEGSTHSTKKAREIVVVGSKIKEPVDS